MRALPPLAQLLGCMVWETSNPRSLMYDSRVKCVSEIRQTSILRLISVTRRLSLCCRSPLEFHVIIRKVLAIVTL